MKRTIYQQALDEIGANRKLREELGRLDPESLKEIERISVICGGIWEERSNPIALTDLDTIAINIRNPARYEWVKLAVTLALLGLSVWLAVWLIGRHG